MSRYSFISKAFLLSLLIGNSFAAVYAQEVARPNEPTWYKPMESASVIDKDLYDKASAQLMDRSVPEMLSTLGSPHAIYRNPVSKMETWLYFVVPVAGAPYVMGMLVNNGKITTVGRHFFADLIPQ